MIDGVSMSPIRVDEDMLPTSVFAIHLTHLNQPAGWLIGEFSLEEMWRMVDRIKIGERGYALVVAPDGQLVAHGDPDKKALVAQARNLTTNPLIALLRTTRRRCACFGRVCRRDGPPRARRRGTHRRRSIGP